MIAYPADAHPAVAAAARLLAEAWSQPLSHDAGHPDCTAVLTCDPRDGARRFRLERHGGCLHVRGDRPRSVYAAVAYYLHHAGRGAAPALPLERASPYPERLIMEDFPFMCYQPTGFEFDLDRYAANLAALGYTAMECNRFSPRQPMEPHHWNYAFTNPSMALFVWTPWHEGVWPRDTIEANARELERTIAAARRYDLAPTLTSFLPRPYPEAFFQIHPGWRGPAFRKRFMERGGHPAVFPLNTDLPEVQAFYETVYRGIFDRYPDIGHLFFWHSDLGTQFYADGEGPGRLRRVDRVAGFHRMIGRLLAERSMAARVWVNPWGLARECLEDLNAALPTPVGFSIKDNPGLSMFAGTEPQVLEDATIVAAELGDVPRRIFDLAATADRAVCLGQYQDFSEDLDPLLAVPHPVMTFRKFRTLQQSPHATSATHWGVIPPDVAPVNPNRDVIREMQWSQGPRVFRDLVGLLCPASLSIGSREQVHAAWRRVDQALQIWPQYWGLRLQDSGLRMRWLTRPFGFRLERQAAALAAAYGDRMIYRILDDEPLDGFSTVDRAQAAEVADLYGDMTDLIAGAEALMDAVESSDNGAREWLRGQVSTLHTLRLFWTTYRHLFAFYAVAPGERLTESRARDAGCRLMRQELGNIQKMRAHLVTSGAGTVIIASRGAWGQCFGPDLDEELMHKERFMRADLAALE